MTETRFTTHRVHELDEALIKAWKALWDKAANASMFNSYDWYLVTKEQSPQKHYVFYVCYREDQLVAILPLESYTVFGIPALGSINSKHILTTGVLIESYDKALWKAFFGFLFQKKAFYLQKIDAKAVGILHELFPNFLYSLISVNPSMSLTESLFDKISKSLLSDIRSIITKNGERLSFKMYTTDLEKHFETLLRIQKSSSKNLKAIDIFEKKETEAYYRMLLKHCSKQVSISFLYYDNEPIAYCYDLYFGNMYMGDQTAYLYDYRKLSPGKVMLYFLIKQLLEKNFTTFDMGGGITTYKMLFTDSYNLFYNVYAAKNPFVMVWWKSINSIRRLKQRLFPKKFIRDHEFLFKPFVTER